MRDRLERDLRRILELAERCRPDESADPELNLEIGGIEARANEALGILEDRAYRQQATRAVGAFEAMISRTFGVEGSGNA